MTAGAGAQQAAGIVGLILLVVTFHAAPAGTMTTIGPLETWHV